jgi:hypothetical protein
MAEDMRVDEPRADVITEAVPVVPCQPLDSIVLMLTADELHLIAATVGADDALALALVCRTFRDVLRACWQHKATAPGQPAARFHTPLSAAVCSLPRTKWAHACGVSLSATLSRLAAEHGRLDALAWLRSRDCEWDESTALAAARSGHVHIIRWAHAHGIPWDMSTTTTSVGLAAIDGGHLPILKYLLDSGLMQLGSKATFKSALPWLAARAGHLQVLQWLHEKGCAFDELTCYSAATGGHLHVLQWLRSIGCPWAHSHVREASHFSGQSEMEEWVESN